MSYSSNVLPPPAFGFQGDYYNAQYWYQEYKNELKDRNICKKNGDQTLSAKECISVWNSTNFTGYIPLLGICAGITHLVIGLSFSKEELPNKYSYIVRGVIEIACLGALVSIVDLVATIYFQYRGRLID